MGTEKSPRPARDTGACGHRPEAAARGTRTCPPSSRACAHQQLRRSTHLLDGAQRVRVLLLRLLDLSQAATPLVILCHLGLRVGRTGRCFGGCPGLHAPLPRPRARPDATLRPTHRHGHRLGAHEVFVDLIALRLLVLHAVIQVLILLHRVAVGCGVS